jgi:uncharacterized protein (TIGR02271 family)
MTLRGMSDLIPGHIHAAVHCFSGSPAPAVTAGFPVRRRYVIDKSQARELIGRELRTTDGTKIGKIGHVYLDDYHDAPEWVTVRTGLFGSNESFVPLAEGDLSDEGVVVPYSKDQIKDAPNISEDGHLSEEQERALYDHYGVPYTTEGSTFADTAGRTAGRTAGDTAGRTGDRTADRAVGDDTSDQETHDAMTRSEQRLDVGTERVETGKARLRKWVEEENVQVDVPVTREKARLVTESVTDRNAGDALDGPELSDGEHEVVLTEERPVVRKETVPVERVRLEKDVETDRRTVEESVGKERIELEGDVDETGRGRR